MMKKMIKVKDPIGPDKSSPSSTAKFETALPSHIAALHIVATISPVFTSTQVPAGLSLIYIPRKPSPIAAVTIVTAIAPVEILTRAPIEGKINISTCYYYFFAKC